MIAPVSSSLRAPARPGTTPAVASSPAVDGFTPSVRSPWTGASTPSADALTLPHGPTAAQAPSEPPALSTPLRLGAALLAGLSLVSVAAHVGVAGAPPASQTAAVVTSFDATRQALGRMQFPDMDPYKASVVGTVWSSAHQAPAGPTVEVAAPQHFARPISVEVDLRNGPQAPLLVILPGLGADSDASHVGALRQMALDRGMNYAVIPNPFSMGWQDAGPKAVPGILPEEAAAVHEVLDGLKAQHPEAFGRVSLVGYSYGGILGAAVLAGQGEGDRVVNGAMVTVSPAVDLMHSMGRLDHLRGDYKTSLDWTDVGLQYGQDVAKYGYEHITDSPLVRRPENDAEKFLADAIGARQPLRPVIGSVDRSSGRNLLPLNHALASGEKLTSSQRAELTDEQEWALDDATFASYTQDYIAHDPWLGRHGLTLPELSQRYSYPRMLESVHGIPVMTLTAADDYILTADDLQALQRHEAAGPAEQVTHVFEHGGHVGLIFQPQVREAMMDFVGRASRGEQPRTR